MLSRRRRTAALGVLALCAQGALGAVLGPAVGFGEGAFGHEGHVGEEAIGVQKAHKGAVSSESKVCSEIGVKILKRGGNAADAMVATTLCVGVIGMQHSGLGGGGFMLVRDAEGKYESIDFRESAPAAAYEDMYDGNVQGSVSGGLSVGVPGDVKGLEYLHTKYGKLPWRAVVNPAVHVSRNGFRVTEDQVNYMHEAMRYANESFLLDNPQFAVDFAPNGTLVGLGDIMTRKRYANTLEEIGKHGSKVFYTGPMANFTIAAIQGSNGTMTLSDMENYQIITRPTVSISYRGYKLFSTSAPSGGSVALSILKIIEGYNASTPFPLALHRLDEAMRFSYAARAELGDPAFFSYMADYEATMLLPSTASSIRTKILDNTTQPVENYSPKKHFSPENHGTSHVVTADDTGMSVTSTSTVNLLFGARLVVPETGVILNDEMNDFSIPHTRNEFGFVPSPINYIRPCKRPLSSITPIIVEYPNGTLFISIGAAGGSRIITSTVQALWYVLDRGLSLKEALDRPRIHDQLMPDRMAFERTDQREFDGEVVDYMAERGHEVFFVGGHQSAVQGVRWEKGRWEAASEPRQGDSGGVVAD